MKKALDNRKPQFRGVSTLDAIGKNFRIILLLLMLSGLSVSTFAGHSILDLVDPGFNPQITAISFGVKTVSAIEVLPDGKILVAGKFNSYNRQPVGGLVRLNADGSLDTTFNNRVVASDKEYDGILVQADGKIILYGTEGIKRYNSDGMLDSSFSSTVLGVRDAAIDSSGRIIIGGVFANGKYVLRLNQNGSSDSSFDSNLTANISGKVDVATQNNKVIVYLSTSPAQVGRLNEDGSVDSTFTAANVNSASAELIVQPDGKILVLAGTSLQRLNENGGVDGNFQTVIFLTSNLASKMRLGSDGRITVATLQERAFRRFLPSGQVDQSFAAFNFEAAYGGFALQSDGSVIIGDSLQGAYPGVGAPNWFARFSSNGARDTSFNAGGIGFQTILSGASQAYVRSVASDQVGKILIAGRFDDVNGVIRSKIARLNADSTVDASFQINRSGEANRFSQIQEISSVRVQSDGKVIVAGTFSYVINGATKSNLIRLNENGSIDSTFSLGVQFNDWSFPNNPLGAIKVALFNDGKLLIGNTRLNSFEPRTPTKLIATGAVDDSFNSTFAPSPLVSIYEAAIQPDGKVLIGGRAGGSVLGADFYGFIVRLNADGSVDQTFQAAQDTGKVVSAFALLSSGQILVVKNNAHTNPTQSDVLRLNSNGSLDNSFNAGTGANGKINAVVSLQNGDIFIGGRFTAFNGQPRQNLARLNANGTLNSMIYDVNDEVLSLELDSEGRLLVGGRFTIINAGGGNTSRSYAARLIDSSQVNQRTRFDFDGDGRADLGVFDNTNGNWSIRNSQTNQISNSQFGTVGDKTAAADFDGDGKADRAVYRASEGIWYLMRSTAGFAAVRWGAAGDKPVPADYDGDGKADVAVFRPSNGIWYILQSSNNQMRAVQWGLTTDVVLPNADYDGDGRADIAVFRPTNGTFYWLSSAANDQFKVMQFGTSGDIPSVGDFNGDGKADFAVFRPSDGTWYQNLTRPDGDYTFSATPFGQNGDEPVAADYDGDGRTDIAVRRQGVWYLLRSQQGFVGSGFGAANAQAVAALPNQ